MTNFRSQLKYLKSLKLNKAYKNKFIKFLLFEYFFIYFRIESLFLKIGYIYLTLKDETSLWKYKLNFHTSHVLNFENRNKNIVIQDFSKSHLSLVDLRAY